MTFPTDGKLFFKEDEQQFSQRHEDLERKREYYHFPHPLEALGIMVLTEVQLLIFISFCGIMYESNSTLRMSEYS